jgi:23S rRNA (cytidine1920-2'-O)/16S rRNA (cytidine1409-2'-O)-methyltransferase
VAWTRQRNILPAARKIVREGGTVVTLIKPHYEADQALLKKGVLPADAVDVVVNQVKEDVRAAGFDVVATVQSPILGGEGNVEVLAELRPTTTDVRVS